MIEKLAKRLAAAGFDCETLGPQPERPSLVARLHGIADGPTLCYLGHADTVAADPARWTHEPWSGTIEDGCIWGRGALDMKGQVAAEVVAAATLAASGWRPARGDLLVVIVADEENGGALGAQWLVEHHPEKIRCDYVINEGAGQILPHDRRLWSVAVGEKGLCRVTVRIPADPGHAAVPALHDSAMPTLAAVLGRVERYTPVREHAEHGTPLLRALADEHIRDRELADMVDAMLGITLAPTKLEGSPRLNQLPEQVLLKLDCRVPPDITPAAVRERVLAAIGEGPYDIEIVPRAAASASPADTPLMSAIAALIGTCDPGAEVMPIVAPLTTDSRFFREAFPGCVAYGFFPLPGTSLADAAKLLHAIDERIDLGDLGFAVRFYVELAQHLLG